MQFVWQSDSEIIKKSCFELEQSEDLNDRRLGSSLKDVCLTCQEDWRRCSGHFGHFRFKTIPLLHPLMLSTARKDLKAWGFPEKIKISQNSLQILKATEWKVLTFLDIRSFIEKKQEEDETVCSSNIKWLRWVLPVSPPCLRPTCFTPERGTSLNDITHRLSSIIRMSQALDNSLQNNPYNYAEHRRFAVRAQLAYTLLFFLPSGARESRELSSLADRFKGKQGRCRQSLLGKRLTFSARSVITGNPDLHLTELGVPVEIAEKLTKPIRVANYNFEYLTDLLQKNQVKYVERSGMRFNPTYRKISLKISDVCHVKLQDGWPIIFNRQPSLWRSSVQSLYVKRVEDKTFQMNAEITPAFNADFDGDEMNLYCPQRLDCAGELEVLMNAREHLIEGGQGCVQDTALGCYLLSLDNQVLEQGVFQKCILFILRELDRNKELLQHFDMTVCNGPYTGRILLSCLLGDKIDIKGLVSKGSVIADLNRKTVKGKILPKISLEYGNKELANFLFLLSKISSEFLRRKGFSVGISALEPEKHVEEIKIDKHVHDFINSVQTKDEWLLLRLGNLYKSLKALNTQQIFSDNNPMLLMGAERSGAKGTLLNLMQIRSSLGQQYWKASLIRNFRGNRVLSSEPIKDSGAVTQEERLARKGFIFSNFFKGLSPDEAVKHAMTSRLSLLDTALKTSETGYASRRLVKSLEDCIVQYDNTLRNGDNVLLFDCSHFKQKDLVPGHPIGVIAAQSIGQRVMQLTLNTFHTAGTANLEVSQGVPRMESLINVWTKKLQQNTIVEIPNVTAWEGHALVREHDHVVIKELLFKKSKVVRMKNSPSSCSQYGLKLFLDEIVCKKKRICAWDVETCIRKSSLFPKIIPLARSKAVTCLLQTEIVSDVEVKQKLLREILPALKQISVRGGIHKAKTTWCNNMVRVKGMDCSLAFAVFSDKWKTISTTNMLEAFNLLGIEAGRTVLLRELNKVFNFGVRHIYLLTLCEYMCWSGSFCPITRNGLLKMNKNAFKSMGFEQCLKTAMRNATENSVSDFSGTTERILINRLIKQGTGMCRIIGEEVLSSEVYENANPVCEEGLDDEFDIYGGLS